MKKALFILLFIFTPVFLAHGAEPVKVLLVPGHDDQVWGAQYGSLKEADMNLSLATILFDNLRKDKRFKVYLTRNSSGYTKEFVDYFSDNGAAIIKFREEAKLEMRKKIESGEFVEKKIVAHNDAVNDVSMILYGLNKWANENKMDAVIHIHFNDYPRVNKWTEGIYKGFSIYIPEEQMANSGKSEGLAQNIFKQLKTKYITSTYPPEAGGLIPDQTLIALGSNGTLLSSVRSLLVEYGYIYRFGNSATRPKSYLNMANLTARGIKNYFFD